MPDFNKQARPARSPNANGDASRERQDRTPLILIEEAIQLLRASPATVYALYCAGTVPFMLALFSFCAEMSYHRNARDNCAVSAVVVALTYCWMKGLQAFCCRELVRVYTGHVHRWWKPRILLAIWARQIACQPLGLLIKPLAWLLVFPVTYVSAFFQNLTRSGRRGTKRHQKKLGTCPPPAETELRGVRSLVSSGPGCFRRSVRGCFFDPIPFEDLARDREFSDAELHLGLLPGPLDRHRLPSSIF